LSHFFYHYISMAFSTSKSPLEKKVAKRIEPLSFPELEADGRNYLKWCIDVKSHLVADDIEGIWNSHSSCYLSNNNESKPPQEANTAEIPTRRPKGGWKSNQQKPNRTPYSKPKDKSYNPSSGSGSRSSNQSN
jgi:hypothetical protein